MAEGGVVLVLKTLVAARRDGDPIWGCVRGSAVGHDGGASIGLAAPSLQSQATVIRNALHIAGCELDELDVIEAHGTGTPLGDPIEWNALAEVFAGRSPALPPCLVGAAKSIFGHLGPVAGLVGVVAVLASLRSGTLPAIRGLDSRNPRLVNSPTLELLSRPRPWPAGHRRRTAGVSAMGFGGVNAHVVLAEAPPDSHCSSEGPESAIPLLLLLSAHDAERLKGLATAYLFRLDQMNGSAAHDLCAMAAWHGERLAFRAAIIARDCEQLRDRLALLAASGQDLARLRYRGIFVSGHVAQKAEQDGQTGAATNDPIRPQSPSEAIAAQFVDGVCVDPSALYPEGSWKRMSLPPYPMRRLRCWAIDTASHSKPSRGLDVSRANVVDGQFILTVPTWRASPVAPSVETRLGTIIVAGSRNAAANLITRLKASGFDARGGSDTATEGAPGTRLVVVEPEHPADFAEQVLRIAPSTCLLVTRNAQPVSGTETNLDLLQAACWALPDVLRKEISGLRCCALDIDGGLTGDLAMAEIVRENWDDAVGLRSGRRHTLSLAPAGATNGGQRLRRDGRYLITGGMGSIAAEVVTWLARNFDARCFVLGRQSGAGVVTPPDAVGSWFGDLAAADAASSAIMSADEALGGIDGVFHLAGRFCRSSLMSATRDGFDQALAAKIGVAEVISEALADRNLDFFAAFGSMAAYHPPASFGAYAAANRALAAFTASRRAAGLPFTTIAWPGWRGTGMGKKLLQSGNDLAPAEALACFEKCLLADAAAILVQNTKSCSASVQPVPPSDAGLRLSQLRKRAASTVAAHLGVDEERLDGQITFSELGLDSIGAASLARSVGDQIGIRLSPADLFTHPTVDELVSLCATRTAESRSPSKPFSAVPATSRATGLDAAGLSTPAVNEGEVAIVGMACRFPGANTCSAFWDLLAQGRDCTGPVPRGRRRGSMASGVFDSCRGGFLEDVEGFDAAAFGLLPTVAGELDPQQRILLEVSHQALEDAAIADLIAGSRTGVFVGASASPFPARQDGPITAHSLIGRGIALLASRLSYTFDLRGPSCVVDTLCSSSLVALHNAVQSLRLGECDHALVAGIRVGLSSEYYEGALAMQAISPSGRCRAFGDAADGMLPGEGCGVLILERLDRALSAGSRIRAVVAGSAVKHHGRSASFATPVAAEQTLTIRAALDDAHLDPSAIDYVEAHGTGTALGDPIEFEGLTRVFPADRDRLLGSVKTNIGHLEPAAGIASVIKVVLALEREQVPPSLYAERVNPAIDLGSARFAVPSRVVEWPRRPGAMRTAAVSSFGLGGTLAHAILTESPSVSDEEPRRVEAELIVPVSAYSESALRHLAGRYAEAFRAPGASAAALSLSISVGRFAKPVRAVCSAVTSSELAAQLDQLKNGDLAISQLGSASGDPARIGFCFSGQGGYHPGQGSELYRFFPSFRDSYDRCRDTLAALGIDLPSPLEASAIDHGRIAPPRVAQPGLVALQIAYADLYAALGVRPIAVVGHSIGEIAAAVCSGALNLEDGLLLVATRSILMQDQPPGAMLALRGKPATIERLLGPLWDRLDLAVVNGPSDLVMAGTTELIADAAERAQRAGIPHALLSVNRAFHSRAMDPILTSFERQIAGLTPHAPQDVALISTLLGEEVGASMLTPVYWRRQIRESVQFERAAQAIAKQTDIIVDIGPDGATARFGANSMTPEATARWLGRAGAHEGETAAIARIAGGLYLAGLPIEWRTMHPERPLVEVPPYAFDRMHNLQRPIAPRSQDGAKDALRAPSPKRFSSDTAAVARNSVFALVEGFAMEVLGLTDIPSDAPLLSLGADSLDLAGLTHRIETRFGTRIATRRFFADLPTIGSIAEYVSAQPQLATHSVVAQARSLHAAGTPPAPLSNGFVDAYRSRTQQSFERAVESRRTLADRRASAGFDFLLKETHYPIVARRAEGAHFEDLDGNLYVDLAMGFGVQLFGHGYPPIVAALRTALEDGFPLGPQSQLAGQAAQLLTRLVGAERVAFCNSGSEAIMLAARLARAASSRDLIVIFDPGYHGFWDGTLFRSANGIVHALSCGLPRGATSSVRVFPFGDCSIIEELLADGASIAAVFVEPVPSRNPAAQNPEFLKMLRRACDEIGAALVFDEVLTGFRCHPGGAAAYFGVQPDLAAYGKILGGGLPIGAVAGRAKFLDGVDGGLWNYGDESYPAQDQVFFASTFAKNPVTMASTCATLAELERAGPSLQENLARRTDALVARINSTLSNTASPIRASNFTSLFSFDVSPQYASFYKHLTHEGVYVWEGRTCFLSTAHTDEDLDHIVEAVEISNRAATGGISHVSSPSSCRIALEAHQIDLLAAASTSAGSAAYNESVLIDLAGNLNELAFVEALTTVVTQHPMLRARFDCAHECFTVESDAKVDVRKADISIDTDILGIVAAASAEPFDLGHAPPLRLHVWRVNSRRTLALIVIHHLVVDAHAFALILKQWGDSYSRRGCFVLRPSAEQRTIGPFASPVDQPRSEAFWRSVYWDGVPDPPARTASAGLTGAQAHSCEVFIASDPHLRAFAADRNVTPTMALLALFADCLHETYAVDDVVVATPMFAPANPLEDVVANRTLMLPIRVQADRDFEAMLHRVRESLLQAAATPPPSLGWLGSRLNLTPRAEGSPLYRFELNVDPWTAAPEFEGLETRAYGLQTPLGALDLSDAGGSVVRLSGAIAKSELSLSAACVGGVWRCVVEARAAAFSRAELDAFGAQLGDNARACFNASGKPKKSGYRERKPVVSPIPSLEECIADRLRLDANRIAVDSGVKQMTFRVLADRSAAIAAGLRSKLTGQEAVVAIAGCREVDMFAAFVGVLRAGATALLIDCKLPSQRVAAMLGQSEAELVIGLSHQKCLANVSDVPFVTYSQLTKSARKKPTRHGAGVRAYLMFTSGSTGRPKGVQIEHRGMLNHLLAKRELLGLVATDVVAVTAPFTFDIVIWQLLVGLVCGCRVTLIEEMDALDPEKLVIAIRERAITVLEIVPAVLDILIEYLKAQLGRVDDLVSLRWVMVTGETLPPALCRAWHELGLGATLVNAYGPTECSDDVTHWIVTPNSATGSHVPIGTAIRNCVLHVLDEDKRPVNDGLPGELWIGGACVGRGYVGNSHETAKHFVPDWTQRDDLPPEWPSTLFRTGDLVQRMENGALIHLGRIDDQIKRNGVRIEPAEIEAVLASAPGVRQAVVNARRVDQGQMIISAYLLPESSDFTPEKSTGVNEASTCATSRSRPDSQIVESDASSLDDDAFLAQVARHCKDHLPAAMLPDGYVVVEAFPLTLNGKVNRDVLPIAGHLARPCHIPGPVFASATERLLISLWAEISGAVLATDAGFLDNGGVSLAICRYTLRLRQTFDVPLNMGDIISAGTPSNLASLIASRADRDAADSETRPIHLQTALDKDRPTFHLVHPAGGGVACYVEIARAMPTISVIGYEALGLDGDSTPRKRIEDMAASYLQALLEVQPQGPYRIAGWSAGGVIAFDMAQQLVSRGKVVDRLVLIDTDNPAAQKQSLASDEEMIRLFRDGLGLAPTNEALPLADDGMEAALRACAEEAAQRGIVSVERSQHDIELLWQVFRANFEAMMAYRPTHYPGTIDIIHAVDPPREDPLLGWGRFADEVRATACDGNHFSIVRGSNGRALAECLSAMLDDAASGREVVPSNLGIR